MVRKKRKKKKRGVESSDLKIIAYRHVIIIDEKKDYF